jgi:co-chaperonin GroES (HSP10)
MEASVFLTDPVPFGDRLLVALLKPAPKLGAAGLVAPDTAVDKGPAQLAEIQECGSGQAAHFSTGDVVIVNKNCGLEIGQLFDLGPDAPRLYIINVTDVIARVSKSAVAPAIEIPRNLQGGGIHFD